MSIPLLRDVRTDGTALGFAVILALVTGLVFGLAPALQASGVGMTSALKDASRGSTEGRGRTWVRSALVVSEVAFACVLLVGAGLLIRSLVSVLDVKMGFEPARAATIRVDPDSRTTTPAQRVAYFDEVLRRVKQAPGIESAAITDALPLGRNRTWGAGAKGVTYERGKYPLAFVRVVSEGYPAAMGVPLLAGRDFAASDMAGKEPVMLVNKTLATRCGPARAIGKYVRGACAKEGRRVVGVVGDVRHLSLEQASGNEMYIPARQCDDLAGAYLVVRSTLPPASSPARCARRSAPSPAPRQQRLPHAAAAGGQVGVAAALHRAAARRLRRLRAGAGVARHLRADLVLRQPAHAGDRHPHGAGRLGARRPVAHPRADAAAGRDRHGDRRRRLVAAGPRRRGLLFGVTPRDPQTFLGMVVVLTTVALVAGYLPARRASRIDPMVALRAE